MNDRQEFCKKVSNCISLINNIYPKYKKEIIKATTLAQLSKECRDFILKHQNKKQNEKEIKEFIDNKLKEL